MIRTILKKGPNNSRAFLQSGFMVTGQTIGAAVATEIEVDAAWRETRFEAVPSCLLSPMQLVRLYYSSVLVYGPVECTWRVSEGCMFTV